MALLLHFISLPLSLIAIPFVSVPLLLSSPHCSFGTSFFSLYVSVPYLAASFPASAFFVLLHPSRFRLSQQSLESKRGWLTQFVRRLSAWEKRTLHDRNQEGSFSHCVLDSAALSCTQTDIHTHTCGDEKYCDLVITRRGGLSEWEWWEGTPWDFPLDQQFIFNYWTEKKGEKKYKKM